MLSAMLPKDTPSALLAAILEEGAQLLKEGFAGSEQKVAPDKAEGFLRLQRVYGDKSEDLDEEVRERLLGCVQEVVSRRPWGDVTVLGALQREGRTGSPDGSWRKGSPSSPTTASCSPSILWWNRSRRS